MIAPVDASMAAAPILGLPYETAMLLAGFLFVVGLMGVMVRRNLLFMLGRRRQPVGHGRLSRNKEPLRS